MYQVGKVTKYSQMMHGQPSIKILPDTICLTEYDMNHSIKELIKWGCH